MSAVKSKNTEEKAKSFQLVKYFSITSIIVIFIGTLLLSILNAHWVRSMQLKKNQDSALLLVKNLNHQIFIQFFLPVALKYGKIQLRDKEQYELLDTVVRSALHSFNIETVTIYDSKTGIASYSYDQALIGKKFSPNLNFQSAISGEPTSKLIQNGNFFKILLGIEKRIKLVTFAPLKIVKAHPDQNVPTIGVIEIIQDLSEDYASIIRFQILVLSTSSIVMIILLLILIFVVKRGESIIQKRTRERLRLEEKLSRAEKLSSIGEMTAGISHEIRNPLGIIKSSADLLKKKMAKVDPSNNIPDIIIEEANRLNNIITDFLNFARPKKLNLTTCHINDIIDKNLSFLSVQTKENGLVVEKICEEGIPEMIADSDMLYQAFLNVFINAMQAMPKGGSIFVKIRHKNNRVKVIVEDEGKGISDKMKKKIWDPFFTTKEEGTGLGLGIVKNIIESHGGTIKLNNRSVGGAKATVELPIRQGA
ncbi:MAG: two-component sensor histidine kinase [Deltaproteobacteria bacterium]|nr:two-component sensor histidine kinase [Deltaproteobacteria bacterium]